MKAWKISLLAFAVALGGCDSDTTVIGGEPEPEPEPIQCEDGKELVDGECVDPAPVEPEPEPEPETVPISEATTMSIALGDMIASNGAIEFTLVTEDDLPITDLTSINLVYLGYPPEGWQAPRTESNFKLGWHQNLAIDCTVGPCDGILEELEPGSYRFTPTKFDWHDDVSRYKVTFTVSGDNVSEEVPLTSIEAAG